MEDRWEELWVVGILAAVLMSSRSQEMNMKAAWWGTLYPEYCYSQIPEDADGEQMQIRIKFRWLHGL